MSQPVQRLRKLTLSSTFRALVTGRTRERETYSRVAYGVERRDAVARFTSASRTRRSGVLAPPNRARVDPWVVEPVRLAAGSGRGVRAPLRTVSFEEPATARAPPSTQGGVPGSFSQNY